MTITTDNQTNKGDNMSADSATALYERVTSDEQFRAQLEAAGTPDDKRRIVTEAGYDVGPDDLPIMRNLAGATELSDEDLEKVAGGMGDVTQSVATGITLTAMAAVLL